MRFSTLLPLATLAVVSLTVAVSPQVATDARPTIVIAPGAWGLPATWDSYISVLRHAGHEVVLVPNLSVGGSIRPLAGLLNDTLHFQATLSGLADAGKEMVLFGHSYGGAIISAATQGFDVATRKAAGKAGGVLLTAFVSAFVLPLHSTGLELLGGKPFSWMDVEGDEVLTNSTLLPNIAFNGLSPKDVEYYMSLQTWTALNAFVEPNTFEPWSHGIPAAYIYTTLDNALPLAAQKAMAGHLKSTNVTEFTTERGHYGFLVDPQESLGIWENIVKIAVSHK